ncbi:hypothetical protein F5Y16DRAFT_367532 [Xylariaceae sp. FL0255]|nr:hypothetical protein F5Y16DRAFT_367532 [Xylariaceae sp. FL0255]
MGWWDSLWASNAGADDPLRKLDPKLREFLEKESPIKYNSNEGRDRQNIDSSSAATKTTTTSTTSSTASTASTSSSSSTTTTTPTTSENASSSGVPSESQFQDGRYAHLWKTYRPLADIEAETKSDHEKLMDVLEGYKDRKSQIGRAALENCALEQVDWRECMNNPSFTERMTMCRDQVRKFEKCYMTQTRLLKALGYLSTLHRSPEVEEEIQMHADTLYHRMLTQEAEIDLARKEGRPIPKFAPVVAKPLVSAPEKELTPEQEETLKTRLEKVPEEEKAAEAEAYKAEVRAKAEVASRVQGLWKQQEEERKMRKERGEETLWDKVAGAFGSTDSGKK